MDTIATTSNQKDINVKKSMFFLHSNLKVCFQIYFVSFGFPCMKNELLLRYIFNLACSGLPRGPFNRATVQISRTYRYASRYDLERTPRFLFHVCYVHVMTTDGLQTLILKVNVIKVYTRSALALCRPKEILHGRYGTRRLGDIFRSP